MMTDFVSSQERISMCKEKIVTFYECDRAFWNCEPWVAHFSSYDGAQIDNETPSDDPIGFGCTEQEAIDNLLENAR